MNKKIYIVDEKAIIAFLKGESGASYLISLFKEAESGQINVYIAISSYGYIYTWAQKESYHLIKIHEILSCLPLIIFNFDPEFIDKVVNFNEIHREFSMEQSILLTFAKEKLATIVTGDKNLKFDDPTISISWV